LRQVPRRARRLSDPLVTPAACLADPADARVTAYVLQSGNYPSERVCSPSPSKLSSRYFVTYITISVLVMLSNISSNSSCCCCCCCCCCCRRRC
jgi:hypothetical protein